MITPDHLCGLEAAIVGAAREGTALAQYLVHCGARVTLHDAKPRTALTKYLQDLDQLDVRLALGYVPADLLDVDVLFLSPGVPPAAPLVEQGRAQGLPISSEPRLFTQSCAAPIVGITGSSGKTTTTSLTGQMFVAAGRRTWVGGNIGTPLIEYLMGSERPDVVVMELSSFQLELFSPEYQGPAVEQRRSPASRVLSLQGWSPEIAAVTNITPNHLDRHGSMAEYVKAKANIVAFQRAQDCAVLNLDDPLVRNLGDMAPGRVLHFSLQEPVEEGAFVRDSRLVLRLDGRETSVLHITEVKLRGLHNVTNVLTASCCALVAGVEPGAIREVATSFSGVPHRLEEVRIWKEALFVNDSIATSPERAMAALRAYDEPIILLAGGRDKHLPWDEWAELAMDRVRAVVAFGEAVPIIEKALADSQARRRSLVPPVALHTATTLEDAVAVAARLVRGGEVVLLSPGGTSFDAFEDFEARGKRFREIVTAL